MAPLVRFKRLHPDAVLPRRATSGSVGYDLTLVEDVSLFMWKVTLGRTGWAMELPLGWVGRIVPRSSSSVMGVIIANSPATVDSDYRGEITILLRYLGPAPRTLEAGTRVAQLLFERVELPELLEVEELSGTERGTGGLGSTGE